MVGRRSQDPQWRMGSHPLYKVWFVQGRLRALDHSLDRPGKLDECSIGQSLNVLANMLDEWLTEQGITERE